MKQDWTSFQSGCDAWNIAVNEEQLMQLERYYDLLIERNRQMNLTAVTEFEEAAVLHFLDSLAMGAFYKGDFPQDARIIDVGTGAGFPGLVLKILFPEWQVTLLDAQKKRTLFLEEVTETLGLSGVCVLHGRAEEVAKEESHREIYAIACARAVSALRVLAEYLLPFVKISGAAVAYKTQGDGAEVSDAEYAVRTLGGGAVSCLDYTLPGGDIKRRLVRINKSKSTPDAYPRRAGMPEKRPL